MADLFVSPVVGKFMEKVIEGLFYYVQDQFKWQTGMKKELERLRDYYPKITAMVSVARRAQTKNQNSALNKWIWKLRDAIDEAEDLLDDFEYMKHQQQDNWQKLIKIGERALKTDPILKRLEEVVQKLDTISVEVSNFLHLLENINQEQRDQQVVLHKTRETGSLPKDDLIGRGKDKKSVIEWLGQPPNTTTGFYCNISLLSIVGHGGMGKTTLLQHVYADEITKEFDLKMWVCVSLNFDVKKVITDMLECLQKKRSSFETLYALQESLQSEVKSKKFLLVLDDIWDDEEGVVVSDKWGNVLSPLAYGGLGSKILITTRTDSVATMIAKVIRKKNEAFRLKGLEEDECWRLLTTHAFADVENPDDHKKLKIIAGELVKKLYGSPLAAKVMGGVLNSNLDESHWRYVLNKSLDHNDIFSILKLSYTFLPEHLQSCFSYCSIFEQDHVFDKEDLIRSWIAVGFIQPSDDNQGEALTVDDIGERYFGDLIKKSFFDKVIYKKGYSEVYKMHDLLHDLAEFVSKQEGFRFVGNEKSVLLEIPETIRYLSVETSNPEVLKTARRFKNLRTFHITYEYDSNLVDALIEIFQETTSIRSLKLHSQLKEIPEEIKYLQHLRYLRIYSAKIKLFPRSLSSLYHLQFIISNGSNRCMYYNDSFPRDMNKLSNLRYLNNYWLNFPGVGKFKFLQELLKFNIRNENGYKIDELQHMNELRILKINNLGNVSDAQEAFNAKLCDKRKLTDLTLDWHVQLMSITVRDIADSDLDEKIYVCFDYEDLNSIKKRDIADPDLDERVLNNLQPPNYLKNLLIHQYMGARSAIWMNEANLIKNLEKIEVSYCFEWEILPPFGLLPFLKYLKLRKMPKVKRLQNKFHGNDMRCVFPSLETLEFIHMETLVDWFDASIVDNLFPCLTKLSLLNCPNSKELPYLPPKLETLEIDNIGWKNLNCCSISNSIPLETLKVSRCPNITSISHCGFPSLKTLHIMNMKALVDWFDASVVNDVFPCLTKLRLSNCPNLQELPCLPPKLETLEIDNIGWKTLNCCNISKSIPLKTLQVFCCPNITSISQCAFPSLETLEFMHIETLVDWFDASVVDDLFPCLTNLCLSNCPNLQELPYLPPKLKTLDICKIGWKTLNCCSISNSIPLETLKVCSCPNITSIYLEGEIGKLEKLILQDLQSLQSLHSSSININSLEIVELDGLPRLRNDYIVEALEHMNDLHRLKLANLEYVRDAQEALNAKLCDKRKLIYLSLNWGKSPSFKNEDRDIDERVLDNLQPHNYLKTLHIINYKGARSAIWMNEAHLINNLQEIQLLECLNWEILPPFGQLFFLKTLKLRSMPKVKRLENKFYGNDMRCVFPSLVTLEFRDMETLVDWFDANVVDYLFPCLTSISLYNCPNLQELLYLPPKLEILEIDNIGWKTLNCCNISKSIPLKTLQVFHCPNITSISQCAFPSLETLEFIDMETLVDWFDSSIVDDLFPCLTKLRLSNCPNLQELPYLPPKLESLKIVKIGWKTLNCCNISKSIPLKTLQVFRCPNITSISLEGEIKKLKELTIEDLPSLQSFPSSLANISSLESLKLAKLPRLQEYPDLPPSLKNFHFN